MTVSTTTNKIIYNGLIGQTIFAYNFRVDQKENMEVYLAGTIIPDGDWTIDGLGDAGGGNVTLNAALTVDQTVTLLRDVSETQEVDYQPFDAFPAETHEGALDKLTMLVQQMQEQVSRSPQLPVDSTLTDYDLGNPVAEKLIQYKADLSGQEPSIYTVQELIDNSGGDEIRTTSPPNPKSGDGWWDADTGKAYTWYEDGTSDQWVERIPVPQYNDVFDAKLDGYDATGLHKAFTGDLDDVTTNSMYTSVTQDITNHPIEVPSDNSTAVFIQTSAFNVNSAIQLFYIISSSTTGVPYQLYWRWRSGGIWNAWKLVVDGGAFTERLAGYDDTGLHSQYIGDLNAILVNSNYVIRPSDISNHPVDFVAWGHITTDMHTNANNGTQTLVGMLGDDKLKTWQRNLDGTVWDAWTLIINGAA